MNKYILMLLLTLLLGSVLFGQTWVRSYSLNGLCPGPYDSASSEVCNIIPAIGGGYLLQGYVDFVWGDIPAFEANVFWKIDENGDVVWRRTGGSAIYQSIVSNGVDRYYCLYNGSSETQLFVYDEEMNFIAYYRFHIINGFFVSLYDMQYVEDGLVFAGKVNGGTVIIKTDFQFNVVWQSDVFGIGDGLAVEQTLNGWVSMTIREFTETNVVGDTLWVYYDSINNTSFYDCTVAADNSIYLLGFFKIWRVNTDDRTLDLVAMDVPGGFDANRDRSIDILPNGNIVYSGYSETNQVLHCYSPNGVHQWSRAYEGLGAIYFGTGSKNLLVMPDGSILFCMYHGGIYLVKADSDGNVVANEDPLAPVPEASVAVYPQPAKSQVTISVKSADVGDLSYAIYNLRGQKVYSGSVNGHSREQSFALPEAAINQMQSGVYLVCLERRHKRIAITKLVVVK